MKKNSYHVPIQNTLTIRSQQQCAQIQNKHRSPRTRNLSQARHQGKERGLRHEIRAVEELADPGAQLLEGGHGRVRGALHRARDAHRRPRLHPLTLLRHRLEQWLHEQPRRGGSGTALPLQVPPRQRADGVAARVPHAGVGRVLEAAHDLGEDFGQVGRGGVRVGRAGDGEQPEGLLLDGGLGLRRGVVEAVEEHGNGVSGEGLDGLFQVLDGDLVGVAVGELGE